MSHETRPGKVQFSELQKPRDLLDLGSGHTAYGHTVVRQLSTSICIPNFIEIGKTFSGRTDGRTDGRTYLLTDISDGSL